MLAMLVCCSCTKQPGRLDLTMYDYRDTRNLVQTLYTAQDLIEKKGLAGLKDMQVNAGQDTYLYVYDMNDVCLYHAGMPELEGKDEHGLVDATGKSVALLVQRALNNPQNPHGWVHYTWWEPGRFYPVPKSSCNIKATLPDGRTVYVGGGMNHPHEEKEFIRIAVDSAADALAQSGHTALDLLKDPRSEYNYRTVRVFAFRPNGEILISPIADQVNFTMDLPACSDAVGHRPFDLALKALKNEPATWQMFTEQMRGERQLVKKILYLRKTTLDGEPLYVGAITDLPLTP